MYIDRGTYIERDDGACIPLDPLNADYQGYLAWVGSGNTASPPPQPAHAELVEQAKAATRIQRQPIIDVLDGLQASALALGNTSRAQVIEAAKQGLRDITQTDLSACTTYEDMRLRVKAAYIGLAMALPADVRLSFSDALK